MVPSVHMLCTFLVTLSSKQSFIYSIIHAVVNDTVMVINITNNIVCVNAISYTSILAESLLALSSIPSTTYNIYLTYITISPIIYDIAYIYHICYH